MSFSDDEYDDDLVDDWEAMAEEDEEEEKKKAEEAAKAKAKKDIVAQDGQDDEQFQAKQPEMTEAAKKIKQRAAERAQDAQNAAALFGGNDTKMIDMKPETTQEMSDYAKKLALLVQSHQASDQYPKFIEQLTTRLAQTLKKESLLELEKTVNISKKQSEDARKADEKKGKKKPAKKKEEATTAATTTTDEKLDLDVTGTGGGVAADDEENFM